MSRDKLNYLCMTMPAELSHLPAHVASLVANWNALLLALEVKVGTSHDEVDPTAAGDKVNKAFGIAVVAIFA